MSQSKETYRNACCRLHRVIANFFAVKAWCRGADCVILDRKVLDKILNLERMKGSRVKWMRQDMKQWFPYIQAIKYDQKDSVGSLYLSRINIDDFMVDAMYDTERARKMNKKGVNTIIFSSRMSKFFSEDSMITELSLLASGLKLPIKKKGGPIKGRKKGSAT